ncbi:MmcQ/YjbR family DNA-binding protein [Actinoplanes sp. NPDC051861]|uniref:MmcQ/YjbR family DNA-binding protein n=1 Tax=Actinoplanes sp. NPDC051861 TaxID=3155170 RepID=UPI003430AA18
MSEPGDVAPEIMERLRLICSGLPDVHEQPGWLGVRWLVRKRTVAHVYTPDVGRAPVYAPFLVDGEPPAVMAFRVPVEDLLGLTAPGFPYLRARWGRNVAVAVLGDHTDWTEITELVTDSYCEMAPKFLAAQVSR